MAIFKGILGALVVGWTIVAFAQAIAAAPIPGAPDLEDVQIGERGERTRIALICAETCDLTKRNDTEFLLRGANADFQLDLTERSQNLSELVAFSAGGGSLLRVKLEREIDRTEAKACSIGGKKAVCIDLFFNGESAAAAQQVAHAQPLRKTADKKTENKPVAAAAAQSSETLGRATAPAIRESRIVSVDQPGLREGAPDRLNRFTQLRPPERLAPPVGVVLAKLQPLEAAQPAHPAAIRLKPPVRPTVSTDVRGQVRMILGKEMTAETCEVADATLKVDPWALSAMTDLGLCELVGGDPEEAEAILSRLLEYTPDNYEAHVGRALIAAQAGERGVARKHFQDALNALPPIAESNRIVEAMNAL